MLRLPVSMYDQLRRDLLRNNTNQTAIEREQMLRNDGAGCLKMAARWQKTGIATLRKNNATLQRIPRPLKADKRRFFGWICKAKRC